VPFCAAGKVAMTVVLARYSAHEGVRSIADSSAAGGIHGTGSRVRFRMLFGRRWRPPALAPVAAPLPAHVGVWKVGYG